MAHLAMWGCALLLLSGCGGGDEISEAGTTVAGKAHLSASLANATIDLHGSDGRILYRDIGRTRDNGTFSLVLPAGHGPNFRLVFVGGSHTGTAFDDRLVVDVANFSPERDLVYANAVTTLAAQYRDRHPQVGVDEAHDRVKRFLGIPAASRTGFDVANPKQTYFAHSALLAHASGASAQLSSQLGGLVDEMDRGVSRRTFVLGATPPPSLHDIKNFFKKAGEGLLHNLGEELFSWGFESILTALGIGSQAELLEQLHEINAKLDELTNLVHEVMSETKQTEAQIVSVALLAAVSDIKAQFAYLTWATEHAHQACPVNPQDQAAADRACAADRQALQESVRARVQAILDPNVGIVHQVELLRTALVSSGNERGALLRWNDYLRTSKPFYADVPYHELVAIGAFYESVQLAATNLIAEAYMARPQPDRASATYYAQLHPAAVLAQDSLIAEQRWATDTVLDNRSKLTWQKAPWSHMNPIDGRNRDGYYDYTFTAERLCRQAGHVRLGGFTQWRVPTDPELHEAVKGSPNPTGNADGGTGIFDWLGKNGFAFGKSEGFFETGFVLGNAYMASTISGTTGLYREALWDRGVDNVYVYGEVGGSERVGVWCVTDETKSAGGE